MRYVALLRGINVGGHRKISMTDLCGFAAALGLDEPRTLLQSGNLVFDGRKRLTGAFEKLLEEEAANRLALRTDFMVRNADEWARIVRANPFEDVARRDPGHLVVMFLKRHPRKGATEDLARINPGPEIIHESGRELYIVFPRGMGTSKLPALMTEARLGTRATGRNWNTVTKLFDAVRS